jgi:hypothetical protein
VTSIQKIVTAMSSGFLLCLSLSQLTQAASDPCIDRKAGQSSIVQCDMERRQGIDTVKGELLGIEGDNYVVQQFYGKEVRLHIDATTQKTGSILLGDSIEAKVKGPKNQREVLSIRPAK